MTRCTDGGTPCLGEERCLTHGLWNALGAQISGFLWNVSLQEVLDGIPPEKFTHAPLAAPSEIPRPRPV
jgi:DNA-binding IscR family transcriptional regulator